MKYLMTSILCMTLSMPSFAECHNAPKRFVENMQTALEETYAGHTTEILKLEFCVDSNIPVGVTIIPLLGQLAYGASDKITTLKLIASLDGRVVRSSVSTQDDAPLKNGSTFYTIVAKEIK